MMGQAGSGRIIRFDCFDYFDSSKRRK